MPYRAVTTSVEGFVQQIACCYLRHGYWFYVKGRVPKGKRPEAIDEKLIAKYGIDVSESTRARRKKGGTFEPAVHSSRTNVRSTGHKRRASLLSRRKSNLIRDIRRVPICYAGYSISYKPGGRNKDGSNDDRWHAHVEIDRNRYLELRAWLSHEAHTRSLNWLAARIYELPIAPYAPVRRQMLVILRDVNRIRKVAGKSDLPTEVLALRRRVVRPFEPKQERDSATNAWI